MASAPETGRSIGCEAIQIFSKSPHSWKAPPLTEEQAKAFRAAFAKSGLAAVSVHHNYLTNLASPKKPNYAASRASFLEDLRRAEAIGAQHLIFHPGAHTGSGPEAGILRIVEALNWTLGETPKFRVRILLENSAGQGTTMGSNFPELARILDGAAEKDRVGVALDTCHLFASGQDFRTEESYGAVKDRITESFGTKKVQAFHLNDSVAGLGGHLDRHANIGRGEIGVEGFLPWVNDRLWAAIPGYLETPLAGDDYAAYLEDLKTLRGLIRSPK